MDIVALIGRILFAIVFIASGAGHFSETESMAGYAASKKLPAAKQAVLGSGIWIMAAGVMVALGLWTDVAALMLVVFLLGTAVVMHNFWAESEAAAQQTKMTQFLKDIGLAGASLSIFVLYGRFGDQMGLTVTGPLLF